MVGSVARRWRRVVRLGRSRIRARAFVEGAAGGAVVHGGKVLELGFSDLIEEAGEVLTLGRREATDIEDRELL